MGTSVNDRLTTPPPKPEEAPGALLREPLSCVYSSYSGVESTHDLRRQQLKDRERTILVFEVGTNRQSVIRHMSRRELLDEARSTSTPLRLRHAPGRLPARLVGADALIKARDVRKVDPLFAGRLEPIILVRCGSITVSLGRTDLRAIITHDRLYFIVPDGADSLLQEVHRILISILDGSLAGEVHSHHSHLSAPHSHPGSPSGSQCGRRTHGGPPHSVPLLAPAIGGESGAAGAGGGAAGAGGGMAGAGGGATCLPVPIGHAGSVVEHGSHPPPFEFAALEAVLMIACSDLHKRQEMVSRSVREALHELRKTVLGTRVVAGSRQLESVFELKQAVRELTLTAQALDRALGDCLDEDDDMARMYLSRLHTADAPLPRRREESAESLLQSPMAPHSPGRGAAAAVPEDEPDEHEEVEMLLESYAQEVGSTLGALEALAYSIESTEKFVSFRLDSARNRLLKVDVLAGILAAMFGCSSFVVGIFGMNLRNPIFEPGWESGLGDGTLFNIVVTVICLVLLLSCAGTYFFFSSSFSFFLRKGGRTPVYFDSTDFVDLGHTTHAGA